MFINILGRVCIPSQGNSPIKECVSSMVILLATKKDFKKYFWLVFSCIFGDYFMCILSVCVCECVCVY